jgi:3-mercaptopyruvate sulfurtransferase SseA
MENRDEPLQTLVIAALFLMQACMPARAADDNFKTAIENYLVAEPIEHLRIQPDALQNDPREDFYFVVDVRPPHEFEAGHLHGAINQPYSTLLANLEAAGGSH